MRILNRNEINMVNLNCKKAKVNDNVILDENKILENAFVLKANNQELVFVSKLEKFSNIIKIDVINNEYSSVQVDESVLSALKYI